MSSLTLFIHVFFFPPFPTPPTFFFFFSSRRRHTRCLSDWSSDVCSSDLWCAGPLQVRRLACWGPGSARVSWSLFSLKFARMTRSFSRRLCLFCSRWRSSPVGFVPGGQCLSIRWLPYVTSEAEAPGRRRVLMNGWQVAMNRFQGLFRKKRDEAELDTEFRVHLEMLTEENMRQGMTPEQARHAARREFGGVEQAKESYREQKGLPVIDNACRDVRYGLRMLRKSPGFTAVAILTLALGMGANTALFSLLNGLVLRNLAVPHPEELVRFGVHSPDDDYTALSLPMFKEFSRAQKVFYGTFAWWGDIVLNVETDGVLSRADVWSVDGNFYPQLGAAPEIGRLFDPEETNPNATVAPQVTVLGYRFWQSHYGGARDIIGRTLKIEGMPFTIVGVTRKGFTGFNAALELEVTLPITAEPLLGGHSNVQKYLQRPDALWLEAAGRLKPSVTLEQARAQLESLWPAIHQAMTPLDKTLAERNHFRGLQLKVESGAKGASFLRRRFAKPLSVVLAMAGVVLLLACVNLASLMLARAASRSREIGVRVALAASRGRLACQRLTYSLTVSVTGAMAGGVLAFWVSRALSAFILGQIYIVPAELNLSPDWRILGFTAGVTIATGVL